MNDEVHDMNDAVHNLKQRLERATAASDAGATEFDPQSVALRDTDTLRDPDIMRETDALRETWLTFGRLLEAADAAGTSAMPQIAMPSREAVAPRTRKPSRSHWLSKGLGLSAALLVATASLAAVVVLFGLQRFNRAPNANPGPAIAVQSQIPSMKSSISPPLQPEFAIVNKPAAPAPMVAKSAPSADWDDADDKQIVAEISAIQLDITLTQRKWNEPNETTQAIEYRINEDAQEIDNGPL